MKKSEYFKFAVYSGITEQSDNGMKELPLPEISEDALSAVLDEIFSVDPISGFPKGDIQYYLSADGNPTVKQWLETNLLQPRGISNNTPEGVTDDDLFEFSRKSDESVDAYRERMMSIYQQAKDFAEMNQEPKSE